ncbi:MULTISPECIES: 3-deoxy-D-manno-octulosonic acid transferase [Comamonadaceae]|uniref:3-deoxy-D-manno-octulosonic acid transferase n=1 Tax=Comamonadaceae TaxID=80864 RepID=UPI002733D691|nr:MULTISPECIES: 3-deoxy-D-manno-octulosonic acid transferase [Comamonadaceae]MDP3191336.1 3-deoxy-D-manno-octulosonic acid transferase [Rhodoferax sp.]MDP3338448.1 3-deoxy-D-manno-octulosonic acid transferase [Rhodoferax sp.]MDP3886519.1 3-deoxy-D-manno-octulosonic acid transferase [Hydrogenophaga sp.]
MILWLYSWLMWLAQPFLRRKLLRRSVQEPGYGQCIEERFGRYAQPVPAHDGPTVWLHAVSLGETRAAAVLITALRQQLPHMRLLLTHGTATGRAEGVKLLEAGDLQAWQPWDTPGSVQRFLNHFKPELGILMETEVWPNLAHGCQRLGVPLVLVNARLSNKSLRQAQRLAWLARPAFAALAGVWAQTPQDAQRLQSLGAKVKGVAGNLKFDAAPNAAQLALGQHWRAQLRTPVVMFASSREGEEQALLQVLRHALPEAASVQWLIVPRHPQRFDEVAAMIEFHGFAVQRRSSWGQGGPAAVAGGAPVIWLGDSLGEMALYYGLADVALLGGSFAPLGGQNLIEAAACSCPVVMGPHTFNFLEAAEQALEAGAALRVADLAQAVAAASELCFDRHRLEIVNQASQRFAHAHQGAARHLAQVVVQISG